MTGAERRQLIADRQAALSVAETLTDAALAQRLRMLVADVRAFGQVARWAYLTEAARRLEVRR